MSDVDVRTKIIGKLKQVIERGVNDRLPGWEAKVEASPDIKWWLKEQAQKMQAAINDDDEILFERAAGSWLKGHERVNELLAEEYRAKAPDDPASWELRYVKWMPIRFIKLECKLGEFFLVPRAPRTRPKAKHWYTVDEMIGMLESGVGDVVKAFDALPVRPDSLPAPVAGEKFVHLDATGPEPKIAYEYKGGVRYGRKGIH